MKKRSKTDPSASGPPASAEARDAPFPVVAIGASAGGLDPIVAFLSAVPRDSGVALVVIQHPDPNYHSMLPELPGRATRIHVFEIVDRMPLRPDAVYAIPPNADLGVADGLLRLSEPAEARGQRLPVNHFFSALAAERGELALGVVFSGMGTRGLQAIQAANGLTLAQFPDSARLDSHAVRCVPAYFPTKVAAAHPDPVELREAAMPGKIQTHVEQLLLQKYSPAAALLNHDGDILYINGRTGAFLEPAAGKANWNIHAMARVEIQAVRDEMQISREELKSANEELQSTNEEPTTSKEEMQSLNEELYTVNAELQSKVDDLDYPDLEADALEVIRTLVFSERQIATRDGRWYNVRIMPYRTVDNVIDGVVVTFINLTEAKLLEAQLRRIQGVALAVAEGEA